MTGSTGKAILLLALAFGLGAAAGGAGATALARRERAEPPSRERRMEWYLDHLTRELALSAGQRDSVRAVLVRYTPQMDSLMRAVRPQFETIRAAMRSEIEAHLDARQKAAFDAMRRQHHGDRNGT